MSAQDLPLRVPPSRPFLQRKKVIANVKDLLWSTIKAFLNIFYFKAHWPSKNETVYWFPQKICGFPFVVVYITVSSNDFLRLILCAWNWDQIVVPLKSYPKAVTIIREFIATFCHSRTNWREIFIVSSALHRLTNGKRNTCCVVPQISLIREYLGGNDDSNISLVDKRVLDTRILWPATSS